jgi:hypothetical protein
MGLAPLAPLERLVTAEECERGCGTFVFSVRVSALRHRIETRQMMDILGKA